MTDQVNDVSPAACSLEAGQLASRRERWLRLADRSLVSKLATETGARLVYRAGPEVEAELGDLAEAERECCGFADWRVREPSRGLVALEVSAAPESAPVVRAMFDVG